MNLELHCLNCIREDSYPYTVLGNKYYYSVGEVICQLRDWIVGISFPIDEVRIKKIKEVVTFRL